VTNAETKLNAKQLNENDRTLRGGESPFINNDLRLTLNSTGVTGRFQKGHPINALGAILTMASCLWDSGLGGSFPSVSPLSVHRHGIWSWGACFLATLSDSFLPFFDRFVVALDLFAGALCGAGGGGGGSTGFFRGFGSVLWRRLSHVWLNRYLVRLIDVAHATCWTGLNCFWVPWGPSIGRRGAVDLSFVGLRDRSAGVWAWCWLAPCLSQ